MFYHSQKLMSNKDLSPPGCRGWIMGVRLGWVSYPLFLGVVIPRVVRPELFVRTTELISCLFNLLSFSNFILAVPRSSVGNNTRA